MDYTAPDKSTTAPDNKWTATEHNQMKAAINSKMDKASVINSLVNPQPGQVLSAEAILMLFGSGNGLVYQGTHNGSQDLYGSDFNKSGFWMPHTTFNTSVHTSYPINKPGMLRVSVGNDFTTFEYITFENLPRSFISTRRPSASPSKWVELVTVDYLIMNGYNPQSLGGTPVITPSSSTGLSYSVTGSGNTDTTGMINVNIESGVIPADEVVQVRFEFETERLPPGVVITQIDQPKCDLFLMTRSEQGFTIGATNFKEGVSEFGFSYFVPPSIPS